MRVNCTSTTTPLSLVGLNSRYDVINTQLIINKVVYDILLRHSGTGNSRQRSVGDCLAAPLRRRQEFVSPLPRSVSHQRPRLADI